MAIERQNFIFVDYENIHEVDLSLISGKPVTVILGVGKQQKTLPKELVRDMMTYRDQVEMVENEHVGKNALDFVLTYEVARYVHSNPKGYFTIVSKDKGFDALVKHLFSRKVFASRVEVFSKIPILDATDYGSLSVPVLANQYWQWIKTTSSPRAKKRSKLLSQINNQFGKSLSGEKCEAVVERLKKMSRISVSENGEVTYLI